MKRLITLMFVLLCATGGTFAQLTGSKSIPGDYATVAAAVTDLNTVGVGLGGVTFNVAAGYTETAPTDGFVITATGTATDPIVFQKSGAGANPVITAPLLAAATAFDGVIKIAGGDYITFDAIDIIENAGNVTNRTDWGYALVKGSATAPFNGCQYVTIKNCNISLDKANTSAIGIYSGNHIATATTSLTITATTDAMNNCKFFNNAISNVYGGISIAGYAAVAPFTLYDSNNEIGVDGANTITNLGGAATSVRAIYGIYQNGLKVANNIINSSLNGLTTTGYGIFISTGTSSNVDIYSNSITLTLTAGTYTSTVNGISNAMGSTAASNTVNIYNNTISNCNISAATTGSFSGIVNSATAATVNIYSNTVTGTTLAGTGAFIGIYNSASMSTNPLTIYSNTISNNTKNGASGNMYCMQATTATVNYYLNSIHDNAAAGTSTFYGYYNGGSPVSETYRDNTIYNLTHSGTGTLNAIQISTASGVKNVYGNTIYGLTSGGSVNGYSSAYGAPANIYKNNIYNLTTTGAATQATGITFSGPSGNIYNNFISDIKATASTNVNAVIGINVSGGTTQNLYYNTIYLNATSSSVTTFGTSGIYANTTPTVELKNNIIVNNSTAIGAAFTVAYRRSSTILTSYSANSNNNDFYAGTPSATNVIFYDGTNSDQTIAAFQTRVAPLDGQSFSNLPPFVNIAAAPYDLHLQTTISTMCESGGVSIAGITDDFDANIRHGEIGYTGTGSAPDVGADEMDGIPSFTCVAPVPGNTVTTANNLCLGDAITLSLQNIQAGTGVSFQWQSSTDGITYADVTGETSSTYNLVPSTDLYYQCVVICQNGPTTGTSTPLQIVFNNHITGTTPASRCGTGTVDLSATGSAGTTINWYNVAMGGTSLGTGSPFTTPVISDTTIFYVAAEIPAIGTVIGAGASTSSGFESPFYHSYGGMKAQYLILASELTAAGLTAGNINTLSINVVSAGTSYSTFNLSLGATASTALTTTFEAGLTNVFSAPAITLNTGLNTITFAIPFAWNGTSNIVIESCWSNNNSGGTSATVKFDNPGFVSEAYFRADSQTPAVLCATATATLTMSARPQFYLNYIPVCSSPRIPVVATVTTPPAITATATPPSICIGSSSTLNVTSTNDPNYTYVWMPGTLTGPSHIVIPGSTTIYNVTATDATAGVNSGCVTTAMVTVTVNPYPTALVISPAADTLCANAIQLLTATGAALDTNGVIGTGVTGSTTSTPFKGNWGGSKNQMLYTAAELTAMGMKPQGVIKDITYGISAFTGPYTFNDFTVGMKNTASSVLTTTLETGVSEVIAPYNLVLSGTAPFSKTLTLNTPFVWDGTSNLLIETCFNNADGGGVVANSASVYYTTTATYQTVYYNSDNNDTVCSVPGTGTRTYTRPNIGFAFTKSIPPVWSPLTDLYTDASATLPYSGTAASLVYTKPTANIIYTATATSQAGCASSATSDIKVNDLAVSLVTSTDITCNGLTNGTITVSKTGGYPGYYYSIDGGTSWQTSNIFSGLAAANYTVMVKDTLNCAVAYASNPVIITEPAAINITSAVPVNVSSCLLPDGTITVTATGGTGILNYTADGSTWQISNVIVGLAAGNYNIQVKDANNCIVDYASNPVTIGTPPAVIIDTVITTNNTCFSSDDATLTITAHAGKTPYTYSIDGGATYVSNGGVFTALEPGIYDVSVKDSNTCVTVYAYNPISITEPDIITITPGSVPVLCNGGSTGIAFADVTGGTAPYDYSWSPVVSSNDSVFGVPEGTYVVTITDDNGCIATENVIVTEPTAVAITSVISTNTLCHNTTDGTISITATGGTGAYSYSIDNGSTWQASGVFNNLPAANYTVVVKDANECTLVYASNPVVIANPTMVSITNVVSTDVNCYGVNDGTITITATGGTPPYQYSINNGGTWQINGNYTGLFAASRVVLVKDLNGCTASWSSNPVVITMPATAVANPTVTSTNVLCLGGSDGSITMSTSGGTPGYEYSIDNGTNYQVSGFFGGLSSGSYTLKVRDANGCIKAYASNPLVISEPATAVSVSTAVGTDLTCNSGANGSIVVTATGGTGALQYSADNGVTWTTNSTITGLAAGDHYIRVKDANGCTDIYTGNPITLTEPIPIIITGISTTDVLCNGNTDGSIEVYGIGGTGILEYSIDGGLTWQSGYSFIGIPAGSYTVMAKDDNECIMAYSSNPVVINEPDAININNVSVTNNLCYGTSTAVIDITAIGGTGTLEYTINNGLSWTSANLFTGLMAGTYNIKVRDENLCTKNYYANPVVITDPDQIIIVAVDSTNVTSYGGHDGTIQVVAYGGTGVLQYSVNNGTTWQVGNLFIGLISGGYYVQVKDANGCVVTYGNNPVIINEPDGINENEGASAVSVYPNPTESEITIQGTFQDEILSIEILTIEGKLLDIVSIDDFVANNMTAKYVFASEVKGIYFVRLITTNNVYLKKISVN